MNRAGLAALLLGAACAPTALAPSIIRLESPDPHKTSTAFGLRSGPRVSQAVNSLTAGTFNGYGDSFSIPEWSVAYDFALTVPLVRGLGFHAGVQAEFFYPIPMVALGGWLGLSYLLKVGSVSFAPAIAARGSSDFGLGSVGGPASTVAGDVSFTLSTRVEDEVWLGVAPFFSYGLVASKADQRYLFAGGYLIGRWSRIEVMGGWGRVVLPDGRSWNVPLIGVRAGEN